MAMVAIRKICLRNFVTLISTLLKAFETVYKKICSGNARLFIIDERSSKYFFFQD